MKELSVFIDESGDFGEYDDQTPYYIISITRVLDCIRLTKLHLYAFWPTREIAMVYLEND